MSLVLYPSLLEKKHNNYLNLKIPAYYKRVIAQLRMLNSYVTRIILKKNTLIVKEEYCHYCSDRNDLMHQLIYCMCYEKQRNKLVPELNQDDNRNAIFFNLMNNLNEKKNKKNCHLDSYYSLKQP